MSLAMRAIVAILPFTGRKRRMSSAEKLRARLFARAEPDAAPIPRALTSVAEITETHVQGRRVITVTPKQKTRLDVVYLHGGAYINPLVGPHWAIVRELVTRLGARVTVPLYRLAPEGSVAGAFTLLDEVYADLLTRADGPVVFAGDSAGGGLAVAFAATLRDSGGVQPARLLLIAPWLDVTGSNPDVVALEPRDPMLAIDGAREAGRLWAGEWGSKHPLVSPIFGDVTGLPPMVVVQGGRDLVQPDVLTLRDRVRAAGGEIELYEYADAFHVFVGLPWLPESRDAWARVAAALQTAETD